MVLSDISIRRPVFATVLSLLLIVLGAIAFTRLPLRELPNIDPPIVSIETAYPGASAAVVETRITQILEDAVSGIEGVDVIQSNSRNGRSGITIEFTLTRDGKALVYVVNAGASVKTEDLSAALAALAPKDEKTQIEWKEEKKARPLEKEGGMTHQGHQAHRRHVGQLRLLGQIARLVHPIEDEGARIGAMHGGAGGFEMGEPGEAVELDEPGGLEHRFCEYALGSA